MLDGAIAVTSNIGMGTTAYHYYEKRFVRLNVIYTDVFSTMAGMATDGSHKRPRSTAIRETVPRKWTPLAGAWASRPRCKDCVNL